MKTVKIIQLQTGHYNFSRPEKKTGICKVFILEDDKKLAEFVTRYESENAQWFEHLVKRCFVSGDFGEIPELWEYAKTQRPWLSSYNYEKEQTFFQKTFEENLHEIKTSVLNKKLDDLKKEQAKILQEIQNITNA